MIGKRISSFVLSMVMLSAVIPANIGFAGNTGNSGAAVTASDASKGNAERYEQEVINKSKAALETLKADISEWFEETDDEAKESLKKAIEESDYIDYLDISIEDITGDDFDENGVFKAENYLEKIDGAAYDGIFEEVYGTGSSYDYDLEYKYEYEFYYMSEIKAAVAAVKADIEEYESDISAADTDEAKEIFKNDLLKKYNTEELEFLTADGYDITFDEESYIVYMRESAHSKAVNEKKLQRTVYLHARGSNYGGTESKTTVYKGDVTNLYFAIDNPNEGRYISSNDKANAAIKGEIETATKGVVENYKNEVIKESNAAIDDIRDRISAWKAETNTVTKTKLRTKIEKAIFREYLNISNIDDIPEEAFENGVFKVENYLDPFDESEYNDVFEAVYGAGGSYDYGFKYEYEYKFYYLKKVEAAIDAVKNDIEEYESDILAAETDEDKEALRDELFAKYNTEELEFLTADEAFAVTFDEDRYMVYTRESLHKERISSDGEYYVGADAEEMVRHREPQYDLNGYTVRIYYNPDYFKLAEENPALTYNTPGAYVSESKDETVNKDTAVTPLDDGLWAYKLEKNNEKNAAGYVSVCATIFANGIYFPNKDGEQGWYNLCSLPLVPYNTGTTEVYIEPVGNDESKFPLTLYAKHNPYLEDDEFSPTFNVTALNSGYHTITIENKPLPSVPIANPAGGIYKENVDVELFGDKDCTIYYRYEGETGTPHRYSHPDPNSDGVIVDEKINIDITRNIICWAVRTEGLTEAEENDPPRSAEKTYSYTIVPDWPYLYRDGENGEKVIIEHQDEYYHNQFFTVYPSANGKEYSEKMDYDSTGRVVYYTYNETLTDKDVPDGTDFTKEHDRNPETQWVRLRDGASFYITSRKLIRLIERKNDTESYSDIAEYTLGVKPDPVYTVPEYVEGKKYTEPQRIELRTKTEGAIIKYTTDKSDPITNGTIYENPIAFDTDTVIRAVAMIPDTNIYSERTRFEYLFESYDDDLVDAFYPRGEYKGSVNVTLTAQNPDYEIEYYVKPGNYDGGAFRPTDEDFSEYDNKAITVDRNQTIYARIKYPDGSYGKIYDFDYVIKPLPPVFSQTSTQFTNATQIDVSTAQEDTDGINFTLYYTVYKVSEGELENDDPKDETNNDRESPTDGTDSAPIGISEYTVVKAVVYADYGNGVGEYSEVVTHSYNLVKSKPGQPMTTLVPGYYTRKNGDPTELTTQFLPVPTRTDVYYKVSYNGNPPISSAPYPGQEGTEAYNYNNEETMNIPVKGETVIYAVAVNQYGIRSEVGKFIYIVTPEAPEAAPSADIYSKDGTLPKIPVTAVPKATVTYTLKDNDGKEQTVIFKAPENDGKFYIDPETGLPYYDEECKNPIDIVSSVGDEGGFKGNMKLSISAELDGVESEKIQYEYNAKNDSSLIAPPYADKEQGMYEEIVQDDQNNVLLVKAYSLNTDPEIVIEYRFGNDDNNKDDPNGGWKTYPPEGDDCIRLKDYTILQLRARDGENNYSKTVSYVYNFKPLPPYFSIPSGTYSTVTGNHVMYDLRRPEEEPATAEDEGAFKYIIKWRYNGEHTQDYEYKHSDGYGGNGDGFDVTKTSSVKAYVVNTLTGEKSDNVVAYYVIEKNINKSGVEILAPYKVPRLAVSKLTQGEYAKGIFLELTEAGNGYYIKYKYSYKNRDETVPHTTNESVFDSTKPIMVNPAMEYITITAWVCDAEGKKISEEDLNETIYFIKHEAPETNLERDPETKGQVVFDKNTDYWPINDYINDEEHKNIILYYTIDGVSDPRDSDSPRFAIKYGDNIEDHKRKLTGAVTIKAVYFSSCETQECYYCKNGAYELCEYPVYGEVGTYKYNVNTVKYVGGGGGGGSTTIDKTRKYTKDIFGYEHPTHISYIKGYPDGSVKPDGSITREEVAAILYRIKNKEYDEPFQTTGELFPDVALERWSVTEIEYMANDGVIYGYPDGEFKPRKGLTRAEFAALICRFVKLDPTAKEDVFPDLNEEHWAYNEIMTLYSAELLDGYEDGTFRPEDEITRAEVMTVINKILGRNPSESYVKSLHYNPFNDLLEEKWYYVIVLEATITHNYYLDDSGLEIKWEDIK